MKRNDPIYFPPNGALVVSRPDRIGDALISSSCLPALRKAFPKALLYYLVNGAVKPLFEDLPCLDGVLELPSSSNIADNRNSLARTLDELGFYGIVHLNPNPLMYEIARLMSIPLRIGWESSEDKSDTLTHMLPDLRLRGIKHEAEYNFDLLKFLGMSLPEKLTPQIHLDPAALHALCQKIPWDLEAHNLVAIHPSAAKDVKRWPAERFAKLAEWIEKKLRLKIASIGGAADDPALVEFAQLTSNFDILRLEGKLTLAESAWFLSKTRLLITSDSGPAHIAAAVNCPQVVLFGRIEPRYGPTRWRPLSEHAILVSTDSVPRSFETKRNFWKRSFESITLEKVKDAIEYVLNLHRPTAP